MKVLNWWTVVSSILVSVLMLKRSVKTKYPTEYLMALSRKIVVAMIRGVY